MYHLSAVAPSHFLEDVALKKSYQGKRILVLGGDGFIGVHVATALQMVGARVSILSRRSTSVLEKAGVTVFHGHLMHQGTLLRALRDQEIVFDLAGSSGAVDSNRDARRNLISECETHLNAFQTAAELAQPPLMVFCSSRTVYGRPAKLPVSESHPLAPGSMYAIHKLTLEHHLRGFARTHALSYVIFRLSNPYGSYLWQQDKNYGIINQFILQALRGDPIRIFGTGAQLRDYIFIDDVVETFLRAAVNPACRNQVFNLGGPAAISVQEAVGVLTRLRPGSPVYHEPWPSDYQTVETGDYVTDLRKLKSVLVDLHQTGFEEGIERTFRTYDGLLHTREEGRGRLGERPRALTRHRAVASGPLQWEGDRVLVTGASGFIGSRLAIELLRGGAWVAAADLKPLPEVLLAYPRLIPMKLDLGDAVQTDRHVRDFQPKTIFHLAARPDGPEIAQQAPGCVNANILATVNLLESARHCPVAGFVLADSAKVYGSAPVPHREDSPVGPGSSYAVSKLAAWNFCRFFAEVHGLPVVSLRPTLVYGPGQGRNLFTFVAQCLASGQPEIVLQGGSQTRDPLYIDDVVDAYLQIAAVANRLSGRAIPIGGGEECTVKELAELFVKVAGYTTSVRCCEEQARATEMPRSYCDNLDAWEAFHWQPTISRVDGLRLTAETLLREQSARVVSETVVALPSSVVSPEVGQTSAELIPAQ